MISSVTELPFNRLMGLQEGEGSSQLTLPAGPQYLNHVGTVHAGALLSLAEAASGEFLLRHFGTDSGVVPVVRRIEAKFRKPASGAVTSRVSATDAQLDELRNNLAAKGRACPPRRGLARRDRNPCALCDCGLVLRSRLMRSSPARH